MLFALWSGPMHTWGIADIAIAIVVILAIVGLVFVAVREFQIPIPQWFIHVLCIVAVAFVVILAIRFLASM